MENSIEIEFSTIIYIYRMVKKIKVVDVSPVHASEEAPQVEEAQPVEEVKEENVIEETQPIVEEVTDKATHEPKGPEKSKPLEYIKCENCNKEVLMKTYKYSHKKICKANPPPPPPTPEQLTKSEFLNSKSRFEPEIKKARAKRIAKPKEQKEEEAPIPKPEFNGIVSFNELKPAPIDPYVAMRQERLMVRQQRVKSLISQAI